MQWNNKLFFILRSGYFFLRYLNCNFIFFVGISGKSSRAVQRLLWCPQPTFRFSTVSKVLASYNQNPAPGRNCESYLTFSPNESSLTCLFFCDFFGSDSYVYLFLINFHYLRISPWLLSCVSVTFYVDSSTWSYYYILSIQPMFCLERINYTLNGNFIGCSWSLL